MRVLFTGISGLAMGKLMRKLARRASRCMKRRALVYKAEKYFLPVAQQTGLLDAAAEKLPSKSSQMILALGLPRPTVKKCWSEAFCRLRQEMSRDVRKERQSGHKKIDIFLCAHCAFYHQLTREIFPPVDLGLLRKWHIDVVITLVDDVENSLDRLRAEDEMFSKKFYSYAGLDGFTNSLANLSLLCWWRTYECMVAEQLAGDLGIQHYCVAVKHPTQTILDMIYRRRRARIYISHPISEPRRQLAGGDQASYTTFTRKLKRACKKLRPHVVLIEPTAIDELRFWTIKLRAWRHGRPTLSLPSYTPRWPIPSESWWVPPDCVQRNPIDPGKHFNGQVLERYAKALEKGRASPPGKTYVELDVASGMLTSLIGQIKDQINARDHKLVEQCDGLFVYGPLYSTGEFHSGIKAEMDYYCQLVLDGKNHEGGIWIYTAEADEELWRQVQLTDLLLRNLENGGILVGRGKEASHKQAVLDAIASVDTSQGSHEIVQQLSGVLVDSHIRVQDPMAKGTLGPAAAGAGVAGQTLLAGLVEKKLRPPYIQLIDRYNRLLRGKRTITYEVRAAPAFSLVKFVDEIVEPGLRKFKRSKEGGE